MGSGGSDSNKNRDWSSIGKDNLIQTTPKPIVSQQSGEIIPSARPCTVFVSVCVFAGVLG